MARKAALLMVCGRVEKGGGASSAYCQLGKRARAVLEQARLVSRLRLDTQSAPIV